jgi:hypothetical protein
MYPGQPDADPSLVPRSATMQNSRWATGLAVQPRLAQARGASGPTYPQVPANAPTTSPGYSQAPANAPSGPRYSPVPTNPSSGHGYPQVSANARTGSAILHGPASKENIASQSVQRPSSLSIKKSAVKIVSAAASASPVQQVTPKPQDGYVIIIITRMQTLSDHLVTQIPRRKYPRQLPPFHQSRHLSSLSYSC